VLRAGVGLGSSLALVRATAGATAGRVLGGAGTLVDGVAGHVPCWVAITWSYRVAAGDASCAGPSAGDERDEWRSIVTVCLT